MKKLLNGARKWLLSLGLKQYENIVQNTSIIELLSCVFRAMYICAKATKHTFGKEVNLDVFKKKFGIEIEFTGISRNKAIRPFNEGNGQMDRALTALLLYKNGVSVGEYISLEAKISKNKDLYSDVLGQSQGGWHEGTEDPAPFIKHRLEMVLSASSFEDRFALVETRMTAEETVRHEAQDRLLYRGYALSST